MRASKALQRETILRRDLEELIRRWEAQDDPGNYPLGYEWEDGCQTGYRCAADDLRRLLGLPNADAELDAATLVQGARA